MSYSFRITAASKTEAMEKVNTELANVVNGQRVHKADVEQARSAAAAFLALLGDPVIGEHIELSMHGSIGGDWDGVGYSRLTHANVSVTAGVQAIPAAA